MPVDNQKLVIIIVNYCKSQDTIDCINSLFENNTFKQEPTIVLIDNGSEDNSFEVFFRLFGEDNRIRLIQNKNNSGFTGGYNLGIKFAKSLNPDWIFLLNNDTLIDENAINYLMDENYDIVIPKILVYENPAIIWAAGARWRNFPPGVVMQGHMNKDILKYNIPGKMEYATGCAIMLNKDSISRLGGFDEDYESYFEDYDFFYKANQLNLKIFYQPASVIFHKVSRTLGNYSKKRWYLIGRNSVLFYLGKNRFRSYVFYFHIIWFIIREVVKGNFILLPSYVSGIIEGFKLMKKLRKLPKC
ncbi:MAG: glycosyltransferase family 2 protein [Anaerolineaceae bacterium]